MASQHSVLCRVAGCQEAWSTNGHCISGVPIMLAHHTSRILCSR